MKHLLAFAILGLLSLFIAHCSAPSQSNLKVSGPAECVLNQLQNNTVCIMHQLQDYSYAGYMQSLAVIPEEFSTEILIEAPKDGKSDASQAIQSYMNQAMAKQGDVLLILPEGLYRIDNPIEFSGKNIVLRGEGPSKTRLVFTNQQAKLIVGGFTSGWSHKDDRWKLTEDAKIGDRVIHLANADGLREGLDIAIDMMVTDKFMEEHMASLWWGDQVGKRHEIFRRQIVAIEDDKLVLDSPLRYPLKIRDEAGVKVFSNHNSGLGLEGVGVHSATETVEKAWELGGKSSAISVSQCRDCWVKNVASFALPGATHHLLSHGLVIDKSYRVTVDEVHMAHTQHRGEGGNGYLFIIGSSNEVLVKNSSGTNGRHNLTFVGRFSNSGNVVHKFKSMGAMICSSLAADLSNRCGVGPIDTHESLAIANLFDQMEVYDGFEIGNRQFKSASVGPTGTLNTVWNMSGTGFLRSYNTKLGYVAGTAPTIKVQTGLEASDPKAKEVMLNTEVEDIAISIGQLMPIPSLYVEQLKRRQAQTR